LTGFRSHALRIVSGFGEAKEKNYKNLLTLSFYLLSWQPMDKNKWIEQLKQLSQEKYNEGYGYQVYVESYTDNEWSHFVSDLETWEETLEMFHTIASIRTEQCQEAQNEIF